MANEQQKAVGTPVSLRERYLIYPSSALPDLATPTAQAFHAEDRRDQAKAAFALVARPGFPVRINALRALKGVECSGLMNLLEWGVVDWPPANRKVMVLVYERPLGGRVVTSLTTEFKPIEESDAVRKVINPLVAALKALKLVNLSHRAIRPTNMFWATAAKDRIVLGDCATAPPAYEQPVLVEPIESAMAHPAGRGAGTSADDVYAFGASLSVLLQGISPVAALDDEAIIRQKIVQGSYGVLIGEARMPLPMIEILRGTLCDDAHERWANEALDLWLHGRRLSPLVAKMEKRAGRGFIFNNKEYFTSRELAIAMARNWEAAPPFILDGRLELWLRRSLENKEKANAVANAAQSAGAEVDKRGALETLVTKVCMILDSRAPIRYKGLAVMPDGFGSLLALAVVEGGDVRIIAEALMRETTKAWFETRDAYNPDNSMLEAHIRAQKTFLDRGTIGNGMERVLYELNETMPCISPWTVDNYVLELRDLLPALNAAAKKADGKGWPVDRHIAAFIAARANFDIERQMSDLALPDQEHSTLGMLNLLATIQWRVGQGGLYGLAAWVAGVMQPAINSFHSREKRRELEKETMRIAREGSLVEMTRLIDNPQDRQMDQLGFDEARAAWAAAQREIMDVEAGRLSNQGDAMRTAQQVAALISVTIAFITVTLLLIAKVL